MLDQISTPSLNIRLSISLTLVENLLNIHTYGWLHKEIRFENVIFIRNKGHLHENVNEELSQYSIFVAGYIHSRVDGPGEMTEPLKSELEADLYRHPSLLSHARQPYRKSLDIFAVGCTLLEIGLWSSLQEILEHHSKISSNIVPSSLPVRSMSDPIQVHSNTYSQVGDEDENENNEKSPSRPDEVEKRSASLAPLHT